MTVWSYRSRPDRVIDGDTVDLIVDLGFHTFTKIRVRLRDIDTPEMRGPEREAGLEAKAYVENWLTTAAQMATNDEWPLRVSTEKTGKYGRWIADITAAVDPSANLVEDLIADGYDWTDKETS